MSGWDVLTYELIAIAHAGTNTRESRRMATNVIVKLASQCIAETHDENVPLRTAVQGRSISILARLVEEVAARSIDPGPADLDVHGHVLDALHGILEQSGDALVYGWDQIISLISTAFVRKSEVSLVSPARLHEC